MNRLTDQTENRGPDWAPPSAPLVMPKQELESRSSWLELADIGRLFLSRRKA
ncbi:hypothetical protein [Tropicimonas isoalkanivorans]|nr:hypothetical protein [Tropicimonas isoalkanivorans]